MLQAIGSLKTSKQNYNLNSRIVKYGVALVDESLQIPITLNDKLINIVNREFIPIYNEFKRAETIFYWVIDQVRYGDRKRRVGYRNAHETFNTKEGVCGEITYLYVALSRCSGLKTNYVSVKRDYKGDKVNHACAAVFTPRLNLVDLSYRKYNVKHKKFQVLSDLEMLTRFRSWR